MQRRHEIQKEIDLCKDKAEMFDLLQEYKSCVDQELQEINECTDHFYVNSGIYEGKPVFKVNPDLPKHLVGPLQVINSISFQRK